MPSPEPSFRQEVRLQQARDAFKKSHANIMGPPPTPPPSLPHKHEASSALHSTAASSTANTDALTQHTVFATMLKGHQDEILRLSEELVIVKKEREELRAKLAAAEASSVKSPVAKRKKLGGTLFGESRDAK